MNIPILNKEVNEFRLVRAGKTSVGLDNYHILCDEMEFPVDGVESFSVFMDCENAKVTIKTCTRNPAVIEIKARRIFIDGYAAIGAEMKRRESDEIWERLKAAKLDPDSDLFDFRAYRESIRDMDAAEQGRRLLDAARRQRKLLKAEPGSCVDRIFREMDSLLESAIGKPEAAPISNQDAAAIAQHAVDEINQRTKELGRSPILTDAADDESDAPTVFPPREEMKERIDATGKKLRGIGDAARKGAEALLAERGEESAAKS